MSIHSVDDFDPTSSTPVLGGTVSQTKIQQQQQPVNDIGGAEKLETPPLAVNGQNDTATNKTGDKLDNGITEPANGDLGRDNSTTVHVNGQNKNTADDIIPSTNEATKVHVTPIEQPISTSVASDPVEKLSQKDPLPVTSSESTVDVPPPIDISAPTEREPATSTSAEVAKEDLASAPVSQVDDGPPAETTTTKTSNDDVPVSATASEATVVAESSTPERKSKSPRGKAKSPAVSTPPTRHSSRAKVNVSTTEDDKQAIENSSAPTTSQNELSPSPKRTKRQAATIAKDAIQASNQPTSTSGSSSTEEVIDPTDHDVNPSDVDDDDDITEGKRKKKSPSPRKGARASSNAGRKRGASSSPSVSAAKKKKGKQSLTSNDDQEMDVDDNQTIAANQGDTPPKRARSSGNKKTPTSTTPESGGEYLRKLRPRK